MNEDLLSVKFETERLICVGDEAWEQHTPPCRTVEGPFVLKHKGKYYLTYSANDCCDPYYAVGFATADSPFGPFEKYEKNPILSKTDAVNGTGHHSFTTTKDGKQLICVYHCHQDLSTVHPRMTCIDPAQFVYDETLGFDILQILGPTVGTQTM